MIRRKTKIIRQQTQQSPHAMPVKIYSTRAIYGTPERRHIVNIPTGATYRLRMRQKAFALCFVKTAGEVSAHHLCVTEPSFYAKLLRSEPTWRLLPAHARNVRCS